MNAPEVWRRVKSGTAREIPGFRCCVCHEVVVGLSPVCPNCNKVNKLVRKCSDERGPQVDQKRLTEK